MSVDGLSTARLDRMNGIMTDHVARGTVPGLVTLVSRHSDVHVNAVGTRAVGGSDPMRRDTIFRIASMTKPIAAAAAMLLLEEGKLRLDEPVDRLLPELSNRRVLKRLDGPLEDTVPAHRPISLRDLLTLRMGMGHLMQDADEWPIQRALNEQKLLQGFPDPQDVPTPDEWLRRVATLPLMHQPGEQWMYDLGLDVLGVLIARASGQPLETFLRERVFAPLGMKDTGFHVPPESLNRLASSYSADPETGALKLYDGVNGSKWSQPTAFPSAAGGLVSTVDDYFAFCHMLLNKGRIGQERFLSRPSVELMTSAHVTPDQQTGMEMFFEGNRSWGFGLSVFVRRDDLSSVPGRFGWDGGLGTSGYTDPQENLIGILMTQRTMDSPVPPDLYLDFWTLAYAAIDD